MAEWHVGGNNLRSRKVGVDRFFVVLRSVFDYGIPQARAMASSRHTLSVIPRAEVAKTGVKLDSHLSCSQCKVLTMDGCVLQTFYAAFAQHKSRSFGAREALLKDHDSSTVGEWPAIVVP